MYKDGLAGMNFSEPCHHVVRFVDRPVLIEPVEPQVIVVFVRNALEACLRSFDALQCDNSRVSALHPMTRLVIVFKFIVVSCSNRIDYCRFRLREQCDYIHVESMGLHKVKGRQCEPLY